MIEVDARGLSCPVPVVRTQKALDQNPGGRVTVLVDSQVSMENVSRLARSRGYSVKVEQVLDGYRLQLAPAGK